MSLSPFIIPADQEKVLWSRDEYLDLMDRPEYDGRKFELLGGVIFEKMPEKQRHRFAVRTIQRALRLAYGESFDVTAGITLPLSNRDAPQPDITVLSVSIDTLRQREETAADVELLVEVVVSRLDLALQKRGIYAAAGVPTYWIVDVNRRSILVHSEPATTGYSRVEEYSTGQIPVNGALVNVETLLPPADMTD